MIDMDHCMVHSFVMPDHSTTNINVSVTDAKAQLTDLVRRAEAGDDVVLTRHGNPAVRLVPVRRTVDPAERRKFLEGLGRSAAARALPGPDAARSQDWLYDENGMPA
jgi:prevent-host-death family protein